MLATVAVEQDAVQLSTRDGQSKWTAPFDICNPKLSVNKDRGFGRRDVATMKALRATRGESEQPEKPAAAPPKRTLTKVLSNDRMRNHRKWLLSSRDFLRWRYSQVVHFDLSRPVMKDAPLPEVVVYEPPPFSREIQIVDGHWHIPLAPDDATLQTNPDGIAAKYMKQHAQEMAANPDGAPGLFEHYREMRSEIGRGWLCVTSTRKEA